MTVRQSVSYEQVATIADTMVGEGITPTVRGVREMLGTGSLSTIMRHLRAWQEARPAATAAAVELPQSLKESLERLDRIVPAAEVSDTTNKMPRRKKAAAG